MSVRSSCAGILAIVKLTGIISRAALDGETAHELIVDVGAELEELEPR